MSNQRVTRQPTETDKIRIEFLRDVFSNVQQLIRFMDQKNTFVLAVVSLLSVALFTLIGIYLDNHPGVEKYVIAILLFWYLFHAGKTVWYSIIVTWARPHTLASKCNGPELIFPLAIRQRHGGSGAGYLRALQQAGPDEIMADYSHQIVEISNIYFVKQHHTNISMRHLLRLVLPWLAVATTITINLLVVRLGTVPRIYILLGVTFVLVCIDWFVLRKHSAVSSTDPSPRTEIHRQGSH